MPRLFRFFAPALLTILPAIAHAQGGMQGVIRDDSTSAPLAGVEVLVQTTSHRAVTNATGRYEMAGVPPGVYQVVFRLVGYLPVRMDVLVREGEVVRANATLVRSEVVLDPIEVTGEMARPRGNMLEAFEERRAMGFGTFIDNEEMRRSEHLRLPDVLRRHSRLELRYACLDDLAIPIEECRGEKGWVAFNPTRRDMLGKLNCPLHVLLDGQMVTRGRWMDLRTFFAIHDLHAAEIYQSAAQLPVQFGGADAACGMIVLWTRRQP